MDFGDNTHKNTTFRKRQITTKIPLLQFSLTPSGARQRVLRLALFFERVIANGNLLFRCSVALFDL